MSDFEAIDRGQRAEAALREFFDPAFFAVIREWEQRIGDVAADTPWDVQRITKLAAAVKVAHAARNMIREIVTEGEVAVEELKRTRRLESIPVEKRKVLGLL